MVGAPLRVVFFGTPEFAVPTLEALLASQHAVVGAVCQPDRPRGRGHKISIGAVKACALSAGVPLLPRYRGAAPVHRAIIAGERETGITIMRVVKALDAGPMMATARRPIGADETSDDVERDLARTGAALLITVVDQLADGAARETPQDDAAATYAHRLTKDDSRIEWDWPAARIHNSIRGLHPWPHAETFLHGRRLILLRSAVIDEPGDAPPGSVLEARSGELVVAAGSGRVQLLELQAEGKRPMQAREFLAGHRVSPGDRFTVAP
jgi:methionyl-tRNA formyltransferase